jgi:hypothetical protein
MVPKAHHLAKVNIFFEKKAQGREKCKFGS